MDQTRPERETYPIHMTHSIDDGQKSLYKALAKAQGEFPSIPKNKEVKKKGVSKTGKEFEYTYFYADLDSIVEATRPILAKNGLAFLQSIDPKEQVCETLIVHEGGGTLQSTCPIILEKSDMQKLGGAITYAKRYGLSAALGISTDDDLDANEYQDEPTSIGHRQNRTEPARESTKQASPAPKSPPPKNFAPGASQNTSQQTASKGTFSGPSQKMIARLYAIANQSGWDLRVMRFVMLKNLGKISEMNREKYDKACTYLEKNQYHPDFKAEFDEWTKTASKEDIEYVNRKEGGSTAPSETKPKPAYVDHTASSHQDPWPTEPPPSFNDQEELPF